MSTINYLVTASHLSPEYTFTNTEVRVYSTTSDYASTQAFYAIHPKLGCGKNYSTRELAIEGLFRSHACYAISFRQI